ncbi:EamA family transporter [Bradyrhizobium sp. CCBAU 051011]|nr:EamA family transporter [Bradyrhizobium sp. CCBAU 051011]
MKRTTRTIALTGLAMVAFAANSVLCRVALSQAAIDPATFTVVRLASGTCVMCLILSLCRKPKQSSGSWPASVALFAYAAAFSFAYISLSAGTGALLLFGAVQATMVSYGLVRGERLPALQWLGLTIAIAGLAALVSPGESAPSVTGACLMLVAGIAWGAYSLLGRGIADPLSVTAGNFLRSLAIAICLYLSVVVFGTNLTAIGLACAILSGAVASGLGYTIWYAALPWLTPAQGASVQLSVPVITTLGGAFVLGEAVTLRLFVSSVAILGGISLVIGSRERALSHTS